MDLTKAKILDSILLKFKGNISITWGELQNGNLNDIASYDIIENNINYLIGDGKLRRDFNHIDSLFLTDMGFATMTDLNNLGYVKKAKKEKRENNIKIGLAVVSILTFCILLFKTCNDYYAK